MKKLKLSLLFFGVLITSIKASAVINNERKTLREDIEMFCKENNLEFEYALGLISEFERESKIHVCSTSEWDDATAEIKKLKADILNKQGAKKEIDRLKLTLSDLENNLIHFEEVLNQK